MSICEEQTKNFVFYIASRLLDIGIEYCLMFDSVMEIREKRET